ncbi:MAG TPA: AAA family ATPase [Solirubrobacteraceae bacterium]
MITEVGSEGPDRTGARTRFVGREAEARAVAKAMDAARAGRPQVLWIEGEAGIGKTAFLSRCLAGVDGMGVLRVSGDESETTLDYGVVTQVLVRARAESGAGGSDAPSEPEPTATPFAVGADVLEVLGAAQADAAVVVAIDDAHWMDTRSAGALLFAMRRLHGDRVLVLIASGPDPPARLGPSWARFLTDAERVQRIRLPGLSAAEVCQLSESLGVGQLTLAAGERLRDHTGGRPLHVKALLEEIPLDTLNFQPGALPAPRSFSATVMARLSELSADAQALVAAAAVAGTRCPLAQAGAVAQLADPAGVLAQALAAEVLSLVPGRLPEEITFRHPLVRAVVYDDLSPARRGDLHLRWADQSAGAEVLAHRAAASHGNDDELAAELAVTAESEVAEGRLAAGIERLLWASRIAADRSRSERALLRAVECTLLAGDVPAAISRRDDVLRCADSPQRSFTVGILAAAEGRLAEAADLFREVVARPDFALHPELEGPLASSLALVYALLGRVEEATAWAQRTIDGPGSAPTVRVTARQAKAISLGMAGRAQEAIADLDELSAAHIDPAPFEPDLTAIRGTMKLWWGDLAGATEDLEAVLRWSRAGAPVRSLPNAYSSLAVADYHLGRWVQGAAHAEMGVELGEDATRMWDLPTMHAVRAHLAAGRGQWDLAEVHVAAAAQAAARAPLPLCIYWATLAAAQLAWVRTEWPTVLATLSPVVASRRVDASAGMGFRVPRLMHAEALIATDRLDEAQEALAGIQLGVTAESDVSRTEVWRLRGELARAGERSEEAAAAFAEARQSAAKAGSPFSQALLELSRGRYLRQSGRRRDAIAALRSARQAFEQLAAAPFVGRCETELSSCGVRAGRQSGDNRYGLTAREEVVARLVASGKSNREVAEELYLSTKAIEYHLSNVFAKVDVRSRHDLAARLNASA